MFEILSPGTSHIDRLKKLREYRATPSIRRYVILEQDSVGATVYTRAGDVWTVETRLAGDTLDLPEISISLPLEDVCRHRLLRRSKPLMSTALTRPMSLPEFLAWGSARSCATSSIASDRSR